MTSVDFGSADSRMLRRALALAGRGYRVHPLDGKVPVVKGWPDVATTDADAVRDLWTPRSDANVGIATGHGLVVIDVDPRNGGTASLAQLEAAHGPLPRAVEVATGGGGLHLWCHSNGSPVPSGVLAPGIDVKSTGGQVVAPGSVHPHTGKTYRFRSGGKASLHDLPVVPEWVVAKLAESREVASVLPDVIPEGDRDSTLFSLAGSMRRRGASEAAMYAALREENATRCASPLPDRQVRKIAASAARYAPEVPSFRSFDSSADGQEVPSFTSFPSSPRGSACPVLDDAALHGVVGDLVRAIGPHTEASTAGILAQILAMVGNAFGRGPGWSVGSDRHSCNLFVVLVGDSSKARKGVSFKEAKRPVVLADPSWEECIVSGASTGEGLIHAVRDDKLDDGGKVIEAGVSDKRALVYESEFASVLRRMRGEGNSLGALLRQAWDGGRLSTLTRTNPLRASDSHVSVIAHITREELAREFTQTDMANGFGNRFLWVRVERSQSLPHGGDLDSVDWRPMVERIAAAIRTAQESDAMPLPFSPKAARLWEREYERLADAAPGMFGAVTSRGEAQVRRLAVIYAVLDDSSTVKIQHLRAALAVWAYCEASAYELFAHRTGDDVADRIVAALSEAPEGLTRKAISDLFARNLSSDRLGAALTDLHTAGKAYPQMESTGGRPAERWHLGTKETKETNEGATTDAPTNQTKETNERRPVSSSSSRSRR